MVDEGGRVETVLDWEALERAQRVAWFWHYTNPGVGICRLRETLDTVQVARTTMPDGLFGLVVGEGLRWRIEVNSRLPLAARHATMGHEYGHTLQRRGLAGGFCAPRSALPAVEMEAHAIGAVLTVPAQAVESLALGDLDTARQIAVELLIPVSYVRMRAALAVFLGERAGSRSEASVYLAASMTAHQLWMARMADYLSAKGECPPLSHATTNDVRPL